MTAWLVQIGLPRMANLFILDNKSIVMTVIIIQLIQACPEKNLPLNLILRSIQKSAYKRQSKDLTLGFV